MLTFLRHNTCIVFSNSNKKDGLFLMANDWLLLMTNKMMKVRFNLFDLFIAASFLMQTPSLAAGCAFSRHMEFSYTQAVGSTRLYFHHSDVIFSFRLHCVCCCFVLFSISSISMRESYFEIIFKSP